MVELHKVVIGSGSAPLHEVFFRYDLGVACTYISAETHNFSHKIKSYRRRHDCRHTYLLDNNCRYIQYCRYPYGYIYRCLYYNSYILFKINIMSSYVQYCTYIVGCLNLSAANSDHAEVPYITLEYPHAGCS